MASETSSTPTNVKAEAETSTKVVVEEKEKKMLVLKSKDDEIFEVDIEVASMSKTIKQMLEDDVTGATIPLPNVTGSILAKVIEYCKKHVNDSKDIRYIAPVSSELSDWDKDFVKLDNDVLIDLIQAANYLNIKSLLDLGCQAVADIIKDFSPEEVRETFNIENDFTPEQEAAVRNEFAWAFE